MFPIVLSVLCIVIALACAIMAVRILPHSRVRLPLYVFLALSLICFFHCTSELLFGDPTEKPLGESIFAIIVMGLILSLLVSYRRVLFSDAHLQAGVLVLVEEVTQARREHEELIESREQIRTILDSAAEAIVTIDDQGIIQTFNRAAERMFGYASPEALGENVTLLMPEPYHSEDDEYITNYLKTDYAKIIGIEREVTGRRKDGTTFPSQLLVAEVGLESRRLFTGIVRDISERKEAEEKLRQSDVWLTDAQRIAHMGFWDWNVETNELYWSDEIYSIFGLTPDLFGATYDAFITAVHPDDRNMVKSAVDAALNEGAPYSIDHRTVLPNGEIRHVHEQGEVTRNASGKATRMLGTVIDITDRKRGEEERVKLEAQLRQSQKMEAIGQLAGGVAHDFNNLLTVINGYSALVMEALGPDNPLREDVAEILDAGKRAGLLTSQLLAFSRKQVLQPTVLNVNVVVLEVEKMLRRLLGEDIELTTVLDPSAGMVEVDRSQLEQSIVNLAVNARDAMPGGGKLRIETGSDHFDENGRGKHPELKPGTYITLAVSDDGIGMDPKTKSHVFEPFFTTKGRGQGTGLGLSIVYGFAQQVGGHIDVYSEPGKGTTFTVYLPVVNKPAEKAAVPSSDMSTYHGTETILLAEDEAKVRELAKRVLTQAGYTILAAADGAEAAKIAKAKNGPIDLLLTDVIMPGMSGRELADMVRPIRSDLKVLYISGYTDSAISRHGVLDDGVAFLQKPFSPTDIVRKVRQVLDAPH